MVAVTERLNQAMLPVPAAPSAPDPPPWTNRTEKLGGDALAAVPVPTSDAKARPTPTTACNTRRPNILTPSIHGTAHRGPHRRAGR
ncbi:hypothetical protein Afil01_30850 [Actinorhabdospora filicis]|uniref:Uncharacterized protein n=1 Tax=Actinorhabdospora filicis TaxID=1785913 RepID=A0A9W6W9R8_9ACTN|nr:hypothetical protein Afil01_30850 [Actinorhabdospora filicis]